MIVVTTPTGNIGSQVLQRLIDKGAPVRVIARDPARIPDGIEAVQGSHDDPAVVAKAFAGADTVFWLVPPDYQTKDYKSVYVDFTRAAAEAFTDQGVQRVVVVSALGRGTSLAANAGLVSASLAMDDLLMGSGVNYRTLALPSFMDNMLMQVPAIKNEGAFFSMMSGDRKMPACATRDIAAVAAELLLDSSWTGQDVVPVLGPEDLSHNDMARIMTEVLDRPIRYQRIPADAYKANLTSHGMSESMAQGMLDMMLAKDEGLDNAEPRTPRSTTPTTFRQWCEEQLKPAVLGR